MALRNIFQDGKKVSTKVRQGKFSDGTLKFAPGPIELLTLPSDTTDTPTSIAIYINTIGIGGGNDEIPLSADNLDFAQARGDFGFTNGNVPLVIEPSSMGNLDKPDGWMSVQRINFI